jgi:class 3 adenylate cyclase
MALLRDYHAAIGEIIINYNGTLERYAGDGLMVVFNDPVPVENPALQAVLMALELREALGALTATWSRLGHGHRPRVRYVLDLYQNSRLMRICPGLASSQSREATS